MHTVDSISPGIRGKKTQEWQEGITVQRSHFSASYLDPLKFKISSETELQHFTPHTK